jgi:glucuronoarabinoxylan endo-1,4-beta-xylanase
LNEVVAHFDEPPAGTLKQECPQPVQPNNSGQLSAVSDVKLVVYDLLGREVAVLVNERKDAGVHEVKFDASNLPSGVYIYRLQAGDLVQTRKMIFVK